MEHTTHHEKKSFFEKYQTPISIVIAGLFIAGAIVFTKMMPERQPAAQSGGQAQTEQQVRAQMIDAAKASGAPKKEFAACLDSKSKEGAINDAVALAGRSGVQGTPTFFVLKDGKQFEVVGARDEATFLKAIADGKAPADQPESPKAEKIVLSETDHLMGPKDAAVTIVEYSDIDCPFCKKAKPTIDKILKDHPEYAFVYRHSPIVQLHPFAAYKAQAAECAASTGGETAFWKFMDIVAK